jgi:ElaA protein
LIRVAPFDELDTRTLYRILRLRAEVFAVEQDCVYLDLDGRDMEPQTLHLWIDLEPSSPRVSAAARLLVGADGTWELGRVVTDATVRGRRLAGSIVDRALELPPAHTPVVIKAQSRLEPWYGRWGFVRNGDEFLEDGIAHVPMARPGR